MRRFVVVGVLLGCLASAGCSGDKAGAAATTPPPAAATTAGTTPAAAATPDSTTAAAAQPAAAVAAPVRVPPSAALTLAQASAVEKHFDAVVDAAHTTWATTALAGVETCQTLKSEKAVLSAQTAAGWKHAKPSATTSTPAAFVAPVGKALPQDFLFVEHYHSPADHFDALSLNVFTRASAAAPWRLCFYPNLFSGQSLPKLATVAKGVGTTASAAARARAKHAAVVLADYLTRRNTAKVAPPAGLTVPFGACPKKYPGCNPPGTFDPYVALTAGVSERFVVTPGPDPIYTFPTADGGSFVVTALKTVETDTAGAGSYLMQPANRPYWTVLVAPGEFRSLTYADSLQVALQISPSGAVRLVGTADLPVSAVETPR